MQYVEQFLPFKIDASYATDTYGCHFDTPEPTFRHKLSPIYKGDRPTMPEELSQQIPYLHALIKAQGIPLYSLPGAEADDIIGTLAKRAVKKVIMSLSQPEIKTWPSWLMTM